MLKRFKGLLLILVICASGMVQSQDNSSYSSFGLGLLGENNFMASRQMGGLGASYRSKEDVNFANPASYAALELISFQGGMSGVVTKQTSAFNSGRAGSVNLSYLNLALPLKKDIWVSTVGIVPFSEKNYLVVDTTDVGSPTGLANIFEGAGTVYAAYWGNGFAWKDFSIGFNLGYLFGGVETANITVPLDEDGALDNNAFLAFERVNSRIRGLYWNIGAQYSIPLITKEVDRRTEELRLDLGLVYNSNYGIGNNSTVESYSYTIYSNLLTIKNEGERFTDFLDDVIETAATGENEGIDGADIDTFQAPMTENVKLKLPQNVQVGFTFVRDVKGYTFWKAGFDFKWSQWSSFNGAEIQNGTNLSNSWRIAAGTEIYPIARGVKGSELKSVKFAQLKYRAGFYYQQTPVAIGNQSINEFGINFGIAIPVRLRFVNDDGFIERKAYHAFALGFEVGRRGTVNDNLVRDNFVRINLGISLNDKWFVKRKYN